MPKDHKNPALVIKDIQSLQYIDINTDPDGYKGTATNRYKIHGIIGIDEKFKKHTATVVIGINPSIANDLQRDHTFTKTGRFLSKYGVSDFYMLNLFSTVSSDPSNIKLKQLKKDKTIWKEFRSELDNADIIVVAWGTTTRREEIEKAKKDTIDFLRENYKNKVFCVVDNNTGKKPLHPLRYNYSDELVNFFDN